MMIKIPLQIPHLSSAVLHTAKKLVLPACLALLYGCVATASSDLGNRQNIYNNLPDLANFGTADGTLVLGYVDRWNATKIKLAAVPEVINATNKRRAPGVFELKNFYDDDPRDKSVWFGPEIELGALYYVPKKYESENGFAVVQKLCGVEKSHGLGDIAVIDGKAPQTDSISRRKFIVSGGVAKGLLRSLTILPVSISANAQYVFEVELTDVRRRFIREDFARRSYQTLTAGPICKNVHLPKTADNKKLLLQEFYYGKMRVKQYGQVELDADAKVVSLKGNYEQLDSSTYFLAFKWFNANED